jgi:hypothetical protein
MQSVFRSHTMSRRCYMSPPPCRRRGLIIAGHCVIDAAEHRAILAAGRARRTSSRCALRGVVQPSFRSRCGTGRHSSRTGRGSSRLRLAVRVTRTGGGERRAHIGGTRAASTGRFRECSRHSAREQRRGENKCYEFLHSQSLADPSVTVMVLSPSPPMRLRHSLKQRACPSRLSRAVARRVRASDRDHVAPAATSALGDRCGRNASVIRATQRSEHALVRTAEGTDDHPQRRGHARKHWSMRAVAGPRQLFDIRTAQADCFTQSRHPASSLANRMSGK